MKNILVPAAHGMVRQRPTMGSLTTDYTARWLLQGTCFRYYAGGYTPLRLRGREF